MMREVEDNSWRDLGRLDQGLAPSRSRRVTSIMNDARVRSLSRQVMNLEMGILPFLSCISWHMMGTLDESLRERPQENRPPSPERGPPPRRPLNALDRPNPDHSSSRGASATLHHDCSSPLVISLQADPRSGDQSTQRNDIPVTVSIHCNICTKYLPSQHFCCLSVNLLTLSINNDHFLIYLFLKGSTISSLPEECIFAAHRADENDLFESLLEDNQIVSDVKSILCLIVSKIRFIFYVQCLLFLFELFVFPRFIMIKATVVLDGETNGAKEVEEEGKIITGEEEKAGWIWRMKTLLVLPVVFFN